MNKIKSKFIYLFIIILTLFYQGLRAKIVYKKCKLEIKGHQLIAEIADNEKKRRIGLMYRSKLAKDSGMWFVFPQKGYYGFWMKNTSIPLSIAFVNEKFEIISIQQMAPLNIIKKYYPPQKVKYALEVNQGWFMQKGIKMGDKIKIFPLTP